MYMCVTEQKSDGLSKSFQLRTSYEPAEAVDLLRMCSVVLCASPHTRIDAHTGRADRARSNNI
jgi:hypothetical protein